MAERDTDEFFHGTDDPMARLDDERRRLDALGRVWQDETTTVRAKDNTFSMTFDGRGDLTEVAFHGSKYKTVAPTELGHRIVETLKQGRLESLEKMAATMNPDSVGGLDLVGIATGKVDPRKAINALMAPLLEGLGAPVRDPRDVRRG
ncbi:hypothetical protein [Pseudonocardia sp. MH-G8]|uniref:hypothetical protein n=1 Tax=Pseudonocardia sp. MH-G8 TaxID=1854588 RepID=UPI000BA121D8|nr:hypothetical protein [Pseudonocardia sp. MH-G8]OZM78830.1 hypothetical protein CFP66_28090 [Pseudonocardia sp. MH-G8]